MRKSRAESGSLLGGLLARCTRALPEELPRLFQEAAATLGASELAVYLVDHEQVALHPLPDKTASEGDELLALDSTLPGRVFRTQQPLVADAGAGQRVWLPLVDGLDRLGVIGLTLPRIDDELLQHYVGLAHLLAELMISKQQYGDHLESVRRTQAMSPAAELHRALLPPLTVGTHRVTISGILQPTYDVGGDAFDYALEADRAQLLLLDAMGRGLSAGLIASVAISAYRARRRQSPGLLDLYAAVDGAVAAQFSSEHFVTGLLVQLDLAGGQLSWINAGHPPPLLLRDNRVVKTLESPTTLPFGMGDPQPHVSVGALQPSDVLVMVTDGVLEARTRNGQFFGEERLVEFLRREAAGRQPAPEALRRLSHAILAHHDGQLLDDATTVVLQWHGAERTEPSPEL